MKAALIAIMIGLLTSTAPAQPPATATDLAARLEAAVNRRSLGTWWGAVVVAKDGKPILAKGFGFATEKLDPITADSLFDIASISKPFTAAAVLRLQMAGKLQVSDPITTYFPDLPESAAKVTLSHLLHHTAGLNDRKAIQRLDFPDRDEAVRLAFAAPPDFEPGERFAYSNAGYVVLAAVIEKASGRRFEDVVRDEVFNPAGMTGSTLLDGKGLDAARGTTRAVGGRGNRPRRLPITADGWGWGLRGTSGVLTSCNDLIQWGQALAGNDLLSPAAKQVYFTPGPGGYACGWFVETNDDGRKRFHHSGSTRGYTAQLSIFPDEHLLIAVLTNETGEAIAVEQALLAEIFPAPPNSLTAKILVKSLIFNQHKMALLEEAKVGAARDADGCTLSILTPDDKPAAVITLSAARAKALAKQLSETAAASPANETPTTAMLGTYKYPGGRDVELGEGLELRLLPDYRSQDEQGRSSIDRRPTLIIVDDNFWPIIVRLNPADAKALAGQLDPK